MFYKKRLKNYSKGSDERIIEVTGRSSCITLIIGVIIFLIEMSVKVIITKHFYEIAWEAMLLLVMIVIFVIIHFLNKIPIGK